VLQHCCSLYSAALPPMRTSTQSRATRVHLQLLRQLPEVGTAPRCDHICTRVRAHRQHIISREEPGLGEVTVDSVVRDFSDRHARRSRPHPPSLSADTKHARPQNLPDDVAFDPHCVSPHPVLKIAICYLTTMYCRFIFLSTDVPSSRSRMGPITSRTTPLVAPPSAHN
jgi:hypothetical protein